MIIKYGDRTAMHMSKNALESVGEERGEGATGAKGRAYRAAAKKCIAIAAAARVKSRR